MNFFSQINIAFKAFNQLGPEPVALNGLYRLGLASGHYKRLTSRAPEMKRVELMGVMPLPGREELCNSLGDEGVSTVLSAADEIAGGKVRLFGGEPVDLVLSLPGKLDTGPPTKPARLPSPGDLFTTAGYQVRLGTGPFRLGVHPRHAPFAWAGTKNTPGLSGNILRLSRRPTRLTSVRTG